ncbi:MAG: hypothetical protein U9R34_00605 [Nanoarchaeota archaeon]|nr:hypothetical protein [Nanoarchaeota archaeon]
MYDPIETDLSLEMLNQIMEQCKKRNIPICVIGGWASYFHVNANYRRAFGQDYMGSRDIDIFFDSKSEKEFVAIVKQFGFEKDGLAFRYEKIFNRETKEYISQEKAKSEPVFNLIYIFLDLFSNKETHILGSWWDLEPLKSISFVQINNISTADINTLINLKCVAIFARDKADKENKDACDLYALLIYSEKEIKSTELLKQAIKKILSRNDLLYAISEHVLLDPGKQNIVEVTLKDKLK